MWRNPPHSKRILLVLGRSVQESPTQHQVMGSINDTDVTSFEVSTLLEYLSPYKEKKQKQKVKKNELPRSAKGNEGRRTKTRIEKG